MYNLALLKCLKKEKGKFFICEFAVLIVGVVAGVDCFVFGNRQRHRIIVVVVAFDVVTGEHVIMAVEDWASTPIVCSPSVTA